MIKDPKLLAAIAKINKEQGAGAVIFGSDIRWDKVPRITSGSLQLDVILGGGWAVNQWHMLLGHECLSAGTHVKFQVRTPDGRMVNHKGGTIEQLWTRFHGLNPDTRIVEDVDYYLASVNDEDRVITNRITDVVRSGRKECFELRTVAGHSIVATAEHKFYTGANYLPLKDLHPGQVVFVHTNTRFKKGVTERNIRPYVSVKHHPTAIPHPMIEKKTGYQYWYCKVRTSHLVMEAAMNGLAYVDYVARLNAGELKGLVTVPKGMHVHHLDEDYLNDDLANLALITPTDHGVLHATERHNELRYEVIPDTVESVTPVGMQVTYDISMAAPYNNFVANKFVVHNSAAKSTIIMKTIAANQAQNPDFTVWWSASEPFDKEFAQILGCDTDRILIHDTNVLEEALDAILEVARERLVDCIVIDSYPAMVPEQEDDEISGKSAPGAGARALNKFFRKQGSATRRSLVSEDRPITCFMVNQWRQQIGVMFGDPRTIPGGKGQNFAVVTKLEVKRAEFIKNGDEPAGIVVSMFTIKNKTHRPNRRAEVDFYFADMDGHPAGSYDEAKELSSVAAGFGLLNETGGSWYEYEGAKMHGLKGVREALTKDPEMAARMRKEVMSLVTHTPVGKKSVDIVKRPRK